MNKKRKAELLNKQLIHYSDRRVDAFLAYKKEQDENKKLLLQSLYEKRKEEDIKFVKKYIKEVEKLFK